MKIRKILICLAYIGVIGILGVHLMKSTPAPKISVIMSTYQRGGSHDRNNLLSRAIDSILTQTESDFEFIIINDGSTDDTAQILKDYARQDARIIVLTNKENKGLPYSLNRGLDKARGTYIARMDDDDFSFATRLAKQVAFLDTHPEITATGCSFTFYQDPPESATSFPSDPDESKLWTFTRVPVVHPCAMIRRSFLEKHHIRYVETYPNAEDMPFWFDVTLKHNGLISNLPECLLHKHANAKKKPDYNSVQNSSVARYQKETFKYFLKQRKDCGRPCECFQALEKSNAVANIISPEALQRKIQEVCPPANALQINHPSWQDYFVFDSETRLHRHYGKDEATILEKTADTIKIQWDKWGIETFIQQPDGTYILQNEDDQI